MEIAYESVLMAGIKLSPSVEGGCREDWVDQKVYIFLDIISARKKPTETPNKLNSSLVIKSLQDAISKSVCRSFNETVQFCFTK